jgi:hypothetical protein
LLNFDILNLFRYQLDVFHTKVKQNVTWRSSRRPGSDKNEPVTTVSGVPFVRFSCVKIQLN